MTTPGCAVSPYQLPGPSGRGSPARLVLISWLARASVLADRFWSAMAPPVSGAPAAMRIESLKLVQFAPIWTVLTVGSSLAVIWCSAWDRACRLSAGPAIAANTHPQTSRASASVLPAAAPTARVRPDPGRRRGTGLTPLPRRAARPRRPAAGPR